MTPRNILASLIIGLVLIGVAPAIAVDWTGYTRETDQVGGLMADGVYDGVFNYDYAGQWGLGSVKHYMELAQDAQQIGVDGEGNPLYEYIIVQYCQPKTGYNIRQYFFGFDNDEIVNTYDLTATYGPDFDRVPAEFYTNTMTYDGYIEPGIIPNWYATWDPNPAVAWAWDLPDDLLDHGESWYGNHLSPGPLLDAGESIDLWPGIAPAPEDEDMMFIFPARDGFGYGIVGWGTVQRIVSTQRLVDGELEWSEEFTPGEPLNRQPVLGRFLPPLAPGDFNGVDGVNDIDIDLLCDFIRNGLDYDSLYDISADGVTGGTDGFVDINDLDYLIRSLVETSLGTGTEYGDFNLDGLVDTTDLTRLATDYGAGDTWAKGNANRNIDLLTDTTDLTILATYYGFEATPDAIPEPVTMVLLGLGACLPLFRRKRR